MKRAHFLGSAMLAVAIGMALAVPFWPDSSHSANRRLDERLDQLEKRIERADDRSRGNEAQLVSTGVVVDDLGRKFHTLEPENAGWINLRGGGGNKWTLPNGDEASVKFVTMTADGAVVMRVKHRTLDQEFALRPSESIRAIDDRGTELRVYTTTLHGVERDRSGAPRRARVSVNYAVESPQ